MRLSYLKLFCDVIQCQSFSEAAALNHVSQSAASQIVLQLEKKLGVQLVDRSTRPLHLTAEGESYYEGCRVLVEQYEALEASVRRLRRPQEASVQVAAIYSIGLRNMNEYIERFQATAPGRAVHIEYLHPHKVYERVLDGRADFGLISYPRKSQELVALPWRREEMFLVCAPGHRLAGRRSVRVADLQGEKYVGFDRELVIRRHVDRFLREHRVSVDIVLEFDSIENVKKAIEEAAGVALLPEPILRKEVNAGLLCALKLADGTLERPLGIIYRRYHALAPAAQQFIELLREPETQTEEPAVRPVLPESRPEGYAQPDRSLAHRIPSKLTS